MHVFKAGALGMVHACMRVYAIDIVEYMLQQRAYVMGLTSTWSMSSPRWLINMTRNLPV